MNQYTYKELADIANSNTNAISQRVKRLGIKGVFNTKSEILLNKFQAEAVLNYRSMRKENHPDKITVIDLHLAGFSIVKISEKTNVSKDFIAKYISEYRNTNEIIVESKSNLNYIEL